MASYLTSSISEELKCSICLDFLTRAVSVDCGHNFCEDCILKHHFMSGRDNFKCPECRQLCNVKNLWPNQQLSIVAQSFKLLQVPLRKSLDQRQMMKTKFSEDIRMDPKTAHPGVIISTDMKTLRGRDSWKTLHCTVQRYDLCGPVLATQSFKSGRHYWEVTVENSSSWDVGLCATSAKKMGEVSPSSSTGYWLLSLRQNKYIVCTTPTMNIPLREKLHKVGIFLDYEAGDIVFYDVDNRCHIYTFTSNFSEPLWPIFSIGPYSKNENILTIDPISDATETPEDDLDTCLETSSKEEPILDPYT